MFTIFTEQTYGADESSAKQEYTKSNVEC